MPKYGKAYNLKRQIQAYMKHSGVKKEDLEPGEMEKMVQFYLNCPKGFQVDHIIPKLFGGEQRLHNLQYLPKKENRRKHYKLCFFTKSCGKYLAVSA